jgi:threonine aldolase
MIAAKATRPILATMTPDGRSGLVDLRSDTVTHPTPAMRKAMHEAELGDDVFSDDPTVNALEERSAELLGKEAGLFVASGTMGNLVAQLGHLGRGQETIAGATTHIVSDEQAGHAVVVGTSVRQMRENPDGTWDLAELNDAFRDPRDLHEPISGLVALENTHAHTMGRPLPVSYVRRVAEIAHAHGVPLHVDGARFFNASVALGLTPRELAQPADTITFCLSKGLACPIGSLVVGPRDFIARARRGRKLVGGGMRQVGVLAAPGLLALAGGPEGMIERLAEDHANARRLAEGLAALDGVESPGGLAQPEPGPLDPSRAVTNFVVFRVRRDRAAFLDALRGRGILMVEYAHGTIRAVTHYGVDTTDVERVLAACAAALRDTSAVGATASPSNLTT